MKSMTGFGHGEVHDEERHITVDLKSFNNRYLDIQVNVPATVTQLEPKLREYLGERVSRGRVELTVRARELQEEITVLLDRRAAETYVTILQELAEVAGFGKEGVRLEHLLSMEGVLKTERNRDVDTFHAAMQPALEEATTMFEASRQREGEATRQDIQEKLVALRGLQASIARRAPELEQSITQNVQRRFHEVLGDQADENRVLAEVAVLLARFDVNEELVRLTTHFDHFESLLDSDDTVGKKLDFLCQEINREVNTIGSKSVLVEINRDVVDMKDALEKIREQLRNVE
jgi:uncharacterized protein (TIGR00255 family)